MHWRKANEHYRSDSFYRVWQARLHCLLNWGMRLAFLFLDRRAIRIIFLLFLELSTNYVIWSVVQWKLPISRFWNRLVGVCVISCLFLTILSLHYWSLIIWKWIRLLSLFRKNSAIKEFLFQIRCVEINYLWVW